MRRVALLTLCCGLALSACATRQAPASQDEDIGDALEQPLRDLSLLRVQAPEVLERAAARPYETADVQDCAGLARELSVLDETLGPDLDVPELESERLGESLAHDLVKDMVGLPFRGVIREVTGAEERAEAYRLAVLSGMVRRGFLKGRASVLGCPAPAAAP